MLVSKVMKSSGVFHVITHTAAIALDVSHVFVLQETHVFKLCACRLDTES